MAISGCLAGTSVQLWQYLLLQASSIGLGGQKEHVCERVALLGKGEDYFLGTASNVRHLQTPNCIGAVGAEAPHEADADAETDGFIDRVTSVSDQAGPGSKTSAGEGSIDNFLRR
ncbi:MULTISPECIES: hypothetical protein [unclassified Aminobacter]|uniref:hypothetical protein n=1 Tax=unclassified Aminobacter TaxID=2644704 RepID=UPI001FD908BE|nr:MULTISPECIES: hypothetical protein [unclassified Aminobacter]